MARGPGCFGKGATVDDDGRLPNLSSLRPHAGTIFPLKLTARGFFNPRKETAGVCPQYRLGKRTHAHYIIAERQERFSAEKSSSMMLARLQMFAHEQGFHCLTVGVSNLGDYGHNSGNSTCFSRPELLLTSLFSLQVHYPLAWQGEHILSG